MTVALTEANLVRAIARVTPCVAHGCDRVMEKPTYGVCKMHWQRLRNGKSFARPVRPLSPHPVEKACSRCGKVQPFEKFTQVAVRSGGTAKRRPNCNACIAAYNSERHYRLRTKYDLGADDYLAMVEAQAGRCAICHQHPSPDRQHNKLYVDHDHKTGAVRGLLCHPCNIALGWMKDSPERLHAAAAYLKRVT